jgi:hypothetical protein
MVKNYKGGERIIREEEEEEILGKKKKRRRSLNSSSCCTHARTHTYVGSGSGPAGLSSKGNPHL